MSSSSISVQVRKNLLGQIAAGTEARVGEAIQRGVFALEAETKRQIVAMGAVDTSNLLNSVAGEPTGALSGEVTVGAEYAGFVNYGTRHMAPRPFADQAVAVVFPQVIEEIQAAAAAAAGR